MRVVILLISVLVATAASYYGAPLMSNNADAILVLVTVFTVFAGFLVAIVTVLGDPGLIPNGSWRIAETHRAEIDAKLIRHVWLFTMYLFAIALLFVGVLLAKTNGHDAIKLWLARAYLFVGTFSFLLTFALPASLLGVQRARVDAEIDRRRNDARIDDSEKP